jgi:hypothetical protein
MKPLPAPPVPGNTDSERISNALGIVLTVSKDEPPKKEARPKPARAGKLARRTGSSPEENDG